ncbi:FRG domain-containing protein [Jeotgalibaca dankookensis]|uniref:FRG domain-containing protein n=1 Tax=Jeotgalibaca dankookensis TaxID=708126 RepID=UPI00078619A4|nr:FRG domain-containing protein [Jeotgalibaca dankookensis]
MSENEVVILKYINKVIENIDTLKKQVFKFSNDDPIICFRGESRDYGETKLTPSLFRISNGAYLDVDLINLLSDYDIPNSLEKSLLAKTISGQHYVQTSRLLDITFNMLPSLYFATEDYDVDGYIYSFVFPESFSPNSEYLNFYYDKIVNQEFFPRQNDFKVITHSYSNERIKSQNGGFILFSGTNFNEIPEEYYNKPILIEAKEKEKIRNELETYFNITESTIYPEKDKRKSIIEKKLSNATYKPKIKNEEYRRIELNYYLRRISFEINLKASNSTPKKELLRILRSEKNSIENYIEKNMIDDWEKEVDFKFKLLERGLRDYGQ